MKNILQEFNSVCPELQWDRYTETSREITAFGWIDRKDGNKDFLVINFTKSAKMYNVWFCTSSAKYSKSFSVITSTQHSDCKKFNSAITGI